MYSIISLNNSQFLLVFIFWVEAVNSFGLFSILNYFWLTLCILCTIVYVRVILTYRLCNIVFLVAANNCFTFFPQENRLTKCTVQSTIMNKKRQWTKQSVQRLIDCLNCILNWLGKWEQIYIMYAYFDLLTSTCQYKNNFYVILIMVQWITFY